MKGRLTTWLRLFPSVWGIVGASWAVLFHGERHSGDKASAGGRRVQERGGEAPWTWSRGEGAAEVDGRSSALVQGHDDQPRSYQHADSYEDQPTSERPSPGPWVLRSSTVHPSSTQRDDADQQGPDA